MVLANPWGVWWRTTTAAVIAAGLLSAAGCDMTPKKIEKAVKEAGTTDEQVDKVMQDFKRQ